MPLPTAPGIIVPQNLHFPLFDVDLLQQKSVSLNQELFTVVAIGVLTVIPRHIPHIDIVESPLSRRSP